MPPGSRDLWMNVTGLVVKLRTKLFILAPAKVNILEMEGFNLTAMTCMGLGDLTKKTTELRFRTSCESLSG